MKGCETNDHKISCAATDPYWIQTIIHEFGHVFDNQFKAISGTGHFASDYPDNSWNLTYEGYKEGDGNSRHPSVQHPSKDDYYDERGPIEDFADMYLNWVLDMDIAYPDNGFTNEGMGNDRRDMMNNASYDPNKDAYPRGMPVWLQMMGLR